MPAESIIILFRILGITNQNEFNFLLQNFPQTIKYIDLDPNFVTSSTKVKNARQCYEGKAPMEDCEEAFDSLQFPIDNNKIQELIINH
jgi:hypothetical protein